MIRILFVCHGNICRSPMAEFIMKDLVREAGYSLAEDPDADSDSADFYIASAATSTEELGNPVYPPARKKLAEHEIDCSGKFACQMKQSDYNKYDLMIGMDEANIRNMTRITGGDPEKKIKMLLSYTGRYEEVSDPWYTRDFNSAWNDIFEGCSALIVYLNRQLHS